MYMTKTQEWLFYDTGIIVGIGPKVLSKGPESQTLAIGSPALNNGPQALESDLRHKVRSLKH